MSVWLTTASATRRDGSTARPAMAKCQGGGDEPRRMVLAFLLHHSRHCRLRGGEAMRMVKRRNPSQVVASRLKRIKAERERRHQTARQNTEKRRIGRK